MKVGVLSTFSGNFGQKGFYNVQEIGLAKELDKLFDEVIIYKVVSRNEEFKSEKVIGCKNAFLNQVPSINLGVNGFMDLSHLDNNIDALIYFSDTQLITARVYKWCERNDVKLIPYIGVVKSHSNNKVKKLIINTLFKRNVKIYKKCECLVKTPQVGEDLKKYGKIKYKIAPVGLDISLLNNSYNKMNIENLKVKWGFHKKNKILLFIGRLHPEKQPVKLIEIFKQIHEKDSTYKLLIVGTGVLYDEIKTKINEENLISHVKIISRIPNRDIWELYRISQFFINLNKQEIFGMAILEAMFYECKVIAWEAAGPNFIIENGKSGVLCSSETDVLNGVFNNGCRQSIGVNSRKRVIEKFSWEATAKVIEGIVSKDG